MQLTLSCFLLERRGWDSNPRCPCRHASFQDSYLSLAMDLVSFKEQLQPKCSHFLFLNALRIKIYLIIFSIKLIRFNFWNNFTRILTKRKVIDVMDIIDKNLTIDRSIP